ncbi:ABC transporter ATP-binding protein [Miltoncostaea oceani]|uniref:ABC transporter ATP-binding protein n=1 Tax=Miltoncostaea oceani TaxID=2843216 RepID=UPI001C3E3AF5|nr:ABC transporter ATP-binding protein [Miltoncostaea oceani]
MAPPRVIVDGVSKRYLLGEHHGGQGNIRDAVTTRVSRLVRGTPRREPAEVWSLRDVSLEIGAGEAFGVIGRNGAGKSTLLKLLSRITEPTSGVVRMRGRVGALLEVGTGFHQELTGRENVYLNGAILGMRRREIDRRFDEIVAFAGIDGFLDTPVKRYSTGMSMRLAFAVAAHLDTDIMIVDEVLAVGDGAFQRKCLNRMGELEGEGRTVVLVSHNLDAISRLCGTCAWLDHGRLRAVGPTSEVIDAYVSAGVEPVARREFVGADAGPVRLRSAAIVDRHGRSSAVLPRDQPFDLEVSFEVRSLVPALDIGVYVEDFRNVRVLDEAWSDTFTGDRGEPGEYVARLTIPPVLPVGDYAIGIWMASHELLAHEPEALLVRLDGTIARSSDGVVQLGLPWHVERHADVAAEERR